jgi:hypothetical protein
MDRRRAEQRAVPAAMSSSVSVVAWKMDEWLRALFETTAAAIASTRAMIDFHGRVFV